MWDGALGPDDAAALRRLEPVKHTFGCPIATDIVNAVIIMER